MKQPEDTKTIDMLAPVKRGRGRPSTGCALTDAERAKRYRENRKLRPLPPVTDLAAENDKLRKTLDSYIDMFCEKNQVISNLESQLSRLTVAPVKRARKA